MDKLEQGEIDVVCFTSASQVHNLLAVAVEQQREGALLTSLNKALVASIGPVCSAALRQFSIRVDIEPQPPKLGPFIQAINARLA
jgi:uroporphyrinogen-III synthase